MGHAAVCPIDFGDHWIINDVYGWRGVPRWPNSDSDFWDLQSDHVDWLLVKEYPRLKAGVHCAQRAEKGVGSHQHSHFEFRIGPRRRSRGLLFWQIFETDKAQNGHLIADIDPMIPARTGNPFVSGDRMPPKHPTIGSWVIEVS